MSIPVHTLNDKCLHEIVPRIFLGSSSAAYSEDILNQHKITHILSLGEFDQPFQHININVFDTPEENIIQYFNETHEFINDSFQAGGSILVHCQAGVSRSPTVLAAYLMRTAGVNAERALAIIKSKRTFICPNSGFLYQLDLYDLLKYDVDPKHQEYRRFLVATMAEQQQANGYIGNLTLTPDPQQQPQQQPHQTASVKITTKPFQSLRCKKCRRILVEAENVIDHTPGPGQQAFAYTKRSTDLHVTEHATNMPSEALPRATVNQALNPLLASLVSHNTHCSSYFIEPMEWISGLQDGQLQGRIECPKCMSKLGSYSWSGEQCSCGRWITPAFMLHRKQVDEVKNVLKRQ